MVNTRIKMAADWALRRRRLAVVGVLVTLLTTAGPAAAIDIQLNFRGDLSQPYVDGNGVERTPDMQLIVAVAAAFWEDIYEDEHTLVLDYWFSNNPDPQISDVTIVGGRIVAADMELPVGIPWYFDPDPLDNDGFAMTPRIFRNMHPVEQGEAFSGNVPPNFEVGYNGYGSPGGVDLLSVVAHEMGHALGLHPDMAGGWCSGGDPFIPIPANKVGGAIMEVGAFVWPGGTDCGHLAVGGIQACNDEPTCEAHQSLMWPGALPNARALPDATAILTIGRYSNFTQIDLPRKYSLRSDAWGVDGMWLGGREPDANDTVYIQDFFGHTVDVTTANAVARNVYVGENSELNIAAGAELDTTELHVADGTAWVTVDGVGATLDVAQLYVDDGLLDNLQGRVDAFRIVNEATIRGSDLINVSVLENRGNIIGIGGTLTIEPETGNGAYTLGNTSAARVYAQSGDIVINGAWASNFYFGDLRVDSGRTLTLAHPLEVRGDTLLVGGGSGGATLAADLTFGFGALLDVTQLGVCAGASTFRPGSGVTVDDVGDQLRLQGLTTYEGGVFVGDGRITQIATGVVRGDTVMGPLDLFDWDGNGPNLFSVENDATLTLNVNRIDVNASDGFDGDLYLLDGTCLVNTPGDWQLEGSAFLATLGFQYGELGGAARCVLEGTLNAGNTATVSGPLTITAGGVVDTYFETSRVELTAAAEDRIEGGAITGPGTLAIAAGTRLYGYGQIDTGLEIAGELRADVAGETLIVNGPIEALGVIGTNRTGATLEVNASGAQWAVLSGGECNLRGGQVTGSNIDVRGLLSGDGTVVPSTDNTSGTVAPSGPGPSELIGQLAFGANYSQLRSATLEIDIAGGIAGPVEHDQVRIVGTARLGGALDVVVAPETVLACGDTFLIMLFGSRVGEFAGYAGLIIDGQLRFHPDYTATTLTLRVVPLADVDGDGMVGFADFSVVTANWGLAGPGLTPMDGDLNGDDMVGFADLAILTSQYGVACP